MGGMGAWEASKHFVVGCLAVWLLWVGVLHMFFVPHDIPSMALIVTECFPAFMGEASDFVYFIISGLGLSKLFLV